MASGEGKIPPSEWPKLVLDGKFTPVVKGMQKSEKDLKSQCFATILTNSCTYIGKIQKGSTATDYADGLGELTYICGKKLAERALEELSQDHIKRMIQAVYFIDYHLFSTGCYNWVEKLSGLIPQFLECIELVNDEEKKAAFSKNLLEMGSIAWNTAYKNTDSHGCPKWNLCQASISLLNKLDQSSSQSACDRACRILTAFCNNVACLKSSLMEILESINPILNSKMSDVNLTKMKQQIKVLLNFLISPKENYEKTSFDSELASLANILPLECAHLVTTLTMPHQLAVDLEEKKMISRNDLDRFLDILSASNSEDMAIQVWTIFIKKKPLDWKILPSAAVLLVQELLAACLPHLPLQYRLDVVSKIILMTEAHCPSKKLEKSWDDHCMAQLKWVTEAFKNVSSRLCTEDLLNYELALFNNISYVGYIFYFKANCCLEAYTLNKFFVDYAFKLADTQNIDEDQAVKLLNCLAQGTSYITISIMNNRPGKEKEMAREALCTCLFLIESVMKLKNKLKPHVVEQFLQRAVKCWTEIRVSAVKILNDADKGLVQYLNFFGIKMEPEDLENLLCKEIETLSVKRDTSTLMYSACKALELLKTKSKIKVQLYRTKLAIATAKCKSEELSEIEESVELVSKLSDILQKEVKKESSLEILVVLVLTLHQEYLSSIKALRVKNQALGDVPLTVRAPSKRNGSEEEQHAAESWENAVELSQLGQVLCCRAESRNFRPLVLIGNYIADIMTLSLTSDDVVFLEPVLLCLECVGLHLTTFGHEWCAIKIWNSFYLLSSMVGCAKRQLRALGWLISKFTLSPTDGFHQWLLEKSSSLKKEIQISEKNLSSDSKFVIRFFDVNLAQCYANSCMPLKAAEIVLRLHSEIDCGANFCSTELLGRTFLVASQIMCCFKKGDPLSDQLAAAFVNNIGAANWAYNWASSYVSVTSPAERDLQDLRLAEFMILSGLWLADLAKVCGFYKTSCYTLQILLLKVQKLHFASRVAQLLSLLGDLDSMVPDTAQVQQRLFWNQKILNLGAAIVGTTSSPQPNREVSPSTSPMQFSRKEHQLTASCSVKCQKSGGSCILCKNPLYQVCKAHYLFLASTNEEAFWKLHAEVEKANLLRSTRLTTFAWDKIFNVEEETGWLQMLQGPLDQLKFRLLLAKYARLAENGEPLAAMEKILILKEQIRNTKAPIARYLENWAVAEETAVGMQLLGVGNWDPELQARSFLLAPEYSSDNASSRPCSPIPNIIIPDKPPNKPKRRGRMPLIDEPPYVGPPNPPKIKVIDFDASSPERVKPSKDARLVPKTCKKPQPSLKERLEQNSPSLDISPDPASTRSRRMLIKPVVDNKRAKTPEQRIPKKTRPAMTTVRRPPSKFSSSSSNDSPQSDVVAKVKSTAVTKRVISSKKVPFIDIGDSEFSSPEVTQVVVQKKKTRKIECSSNDDDVFEPKTNTRLRRN